jgi:aldehyde:ferredoxin oxidoreductase
LLKKIRDNARVEIIGDAMNRYAWAGHILKVNLTSGEIQLEDTESLVGNFIGGRGFGQNILFETLAPEVSPLDLESVIVFATGPLTGTLAPGSSRLSISGKNALTGGIGSSNVGGHFAPELKYAGFDGLIVEGRSDKPVYLLIKNKGAAIKSAAHLRDNTTWETEEALRNEHGRRLRVLSIGPAGERESLAACIIVDKVHAAGRCGFAAVMGSKNLKAVAVQGSLPINVADPDRFIAAVDRAQSQIFKTETVKRFRTFGTLGSVPRANAACTIPFRNFQDDHVDEAKLARVAVSVFQENFKVRKMSCLGCFFRCTSLYMIGDEDRESFCVEGFHQNLIWDFVGKLDITDPKAVLTIQYLCSQYGLDIDNTSGSIALAFELFEKGIINESVTDGLKLSWGNADAVIQLIEKIAYNEGFGRILKDGAYRAAKLLGSEAEPYAIHIKGQDLAEAIRSAKGWALGNVVAPRGGGHLNGATMTGMMKIPPEKSLAVFNTPYAGDQDTYSGKADVVYYYERLKGIVDSVGLCYFTSKWVDVDFLGPEDYAELLNAASGKSYSGESLMFIGRKIHNIEKAFNTLHANFSKEDDFPPKRFMVEPIKSGPYRGSLLKHEDWQTMLEEYYGLHGWDKQTGLQPESMLKDLGLESVAKKLRAAGRLG